MTDSPKPEVPVSSLPPKTPKQMARYAVEEAMNKMIDLPLGYSEHSDEAKQVDNASPKYQADFYRQVRKYANRILKNIGSEDRYDA